MASTKTLEDMLSSEVDESAVSALVGSLESQLASPTIHVPSQEISASSIAVNHVNSTSIGGGCVTATGDTFVVNRQILQQNQIQGGGVGGGGGGGNGQQQQQNHRVLLNSTASSSSSPSVITSTEAATAATKSQIIVSNAQIVPITASTVTTVATNSNNNNTFAVTLPGALPASGYISQFQTVSVNPNAAGILQRTTNIPNGNAGSTANALLAAAAAQKAQKPMQTATSTNLNISLSGIGAMQNLATVAARQSPLVIPTSQQQQQQQTLQSYDPYPNQRSDSYNRGVPRGSSEPYSERNRHWSTLASCAYRGHPAQTVITVAKPGQTQTLIPATHVTSAATGQPVNMVTQMVSNQQILQNVQIVNFNPQPRVTSSPSTPGQKTLAPRVVIGNPVRITTGPQVIGARPGTPGTQGGLQNTITLQPGMVRGTLLVKTDSGQYQLVNVGPALTPCTTAGAMPGTTTYRLQSVPSGHQAPVRALTSQQVTVTMPVSHANQHIRMHQPQGSPQVVHTVLQAHQPQQTVNLVSAAAVSHTTTHSVATPPASVMQHVGVRSGNPATIVAVQPSTQSQQMCVVTAANTVVPTTASVPVANATVTAQSTAASQMSPDTAKKKCKNFLSTLLRLASDQPEQVATNVRNLIQGLIDGGVPPEDFTNQLQRELNSSPQPCLIPFLKKSLPYLRQSLITRELTIEGVRAPPLEAATLPPTPAIIPQIQIASRPQMHLAQTAPHIRLLASTPGATSITSQIPQQTSISDLIAQRHMAPGHRLQSPIIATQASHILTGGSIRPMVTTAMTMAHSTLTTEKKPHSASSSRAAKAAAAKAAAAAAAASATAMAAAAATKEKEKRSSSSYSSALKEDDDINDVAAMGGVNLIEESARIMAANAEFVGTQIRSCKDENFLFTGPLQRRIRAIAARFGLEEPSAEVAAVVSHAVQERLKDIVEKLGAIAEHRLDIVKSDPRHEVSQDVKGQLKFLEELDKLEKKRHEEQEREILMRAAKSRSKLEDPEQLKLKQKAKEMQRAELEEMRQREANMTALLAIGPRKKFKADTNAGNNGQQASTSSPSSGSFNPSSRPQVLRPRVKRVNLRDLVFLMEQERHTSHSVTLYKAFLK